jgi:hypothetical protein
MDIKDYYSSLDRQGRREFANQVYVKTGIGYNGLRRRLKLDNWSKLEREKLQEIIKDGN